MTGTRDTGADLSEGGPVGGGPVPDVLAAGGGEESPAALKLSTGRAVAPLRALLDPTPAEDILVLSYTANLGFFSRAVAGRARSRGARVSLISDPSQTNFDPELVRGAGIDWLDGRAWCDGAFHPKLIVTASDTHATVCVGSGNATPAGWVTNAELWIRFDATAQEVPAPVAQIAAWLAGLDQAAAGGALHLGPGTTEVIGAAAKRLATFATTDRQLDPDGALKAQIISNLAGPIIDGLPQGPVDELIISSPFLDDACEGLGKVCERLLPRCLTVCVTDDFRFNGPALARLTEEWNGSVAAITDQRIHHGKLLEWSIDGQRQALIGSPNVTRAGLLRTLGDPDANCELAVICDLPSSLAPTLGDPLSAGALDAHAYRPPTTTHAPMLVGAVITGVGTELTLARAASTDLDVESYNGTVWAPTGHVVPKGSTTLLIEGWHPPAGSPLRVRPTGGGEASAPYPATDIHRLAPRRPSRSHLPGSSDAFPDDPIFLDRLRDALARLRATWNIQTGPTPAHHVAAGGSGGIRQNSGSGSGNGPPQDDPGPSWETTPLGRLQHETGAAFSEFVLPELVTRSGEWRPSTAAPPPEPGPTEEDPEADPDVEEAARRRRERRIRDLRRWCNSQLDPTAQTPELKKLHQDTAGTCTLGDICVASVVIAADALAAWPDPEEGRITVTRALRPLAWSPESTDLAGPAASAAAVGIWILSHLAEESEQASAAQANVRAVAAKLSDCLNNLDERGLADRCTSLVTLERPTPPDHQAVYNLVLEAVCPDPIADLVAHFGEQIASATGRVMTLDHVLPGDGVVHILDAWKLLDAAAPIAVLSESAASGRMLVAWQAPYLVIAHQKAVRRAFLYELKSGLGAVAATDNRRPPGHAQLDAWYRMDPAPGAADAVIAATGASLDWIAS